MSDHVCRCAQCHSDEFPSGERQCLNHIGWRFEDATYAERSARPSLNGEPVFFAHEFLIGPNGWIRRHGRNATHTCACGAAVCEEMLYGNVTAVMDHVARDIESRIEYMEAHKHYFRAKHDDGSVTNELESWPEYKALKRALRLKRFQRCPVCDRHVTSCDSPDRLVTFYTCDCLWSYAITAEDWAKALHRDDIYFRMAVDGLETETVRSESEKL